MAKFIARPARGQPRHPLLLCGLDLSGIGVCWRREPLAGSLPPSGADRGCFFDSWRSLRSCGLPAQRTSDRSDVGGFLVPALPSRSDFTSFGGCVLWFHVGAGGESFSNSQSAHAENSLETRPGGGPDIISCQLRARPVHPVSGARRRILFRFVNVVWALPLRLVVPNVGEPPMTMMS